MMVPCPPPPRVTIEGWLLFRGGTCSPFEEETSTRGWVGWFHPRGWAEGGGLKICERWGARHDATMMMSELPHPLAA